MLIELSVEQVALQAELRSYFAGLITAAEREEMIRQRHGPAYRAVVRRMGRDGWLGLGWPKEYGGQGLGAIEQQILVNEAARADVPLPAVTLQTVGPTLQRYGTAEQKDLFLEPFWPGRCISPSATPSRKPVPTWPGCVPQRPGTGTATG